ERRGRHGPSPRRPERAPRPQPGGDSMKPQISRAAAVLAGSILAFAAQAQDQAQDNITAAYDEDGKHFTEDGVPTFAVTEDGTVDWYTFSGYRRYHSECHVCHGPDGQ